MRISLALVLLLPACAGLDSPRPQTAIRLDIPATYKEAGNGQNSRIALSWLDSFRDPKLSALVAEALKNNHNLQAAASRLRSAEQTAIIGRARLLPDITTTTGTSANYDRSSDQINENYNLSFSANWEVDLWGRLENLQRASYYDFESAVADFRSAQLSLAANTAQSYLNLISAQQQVNLAVTTLESFTKNLRIIERNFRAGTGDASDLDVAFGRNNVASAERSLLSRKLDLGNASRALEQLLGRYPAGELTAMPKLPRLAQSIPSGIPSRLLARRPDIVSDRATILASVERSEAARKDFLPSLRLSTGAANNAGNRFSRIFDPNFILYTAAANLSQSIYSGGELTARAKQALEANRGALEAYAQTAINAFREVESALDAERSLARQERFLETEVEKAAVAEKFAERSYVEGGNILSVLEAQRRVNGARATLIALRNSRLQNRVDIHLALGGSY